MPNIQETIENVKQYDPELARQIQKYVKDHSYGLVFEHNLPEAVRLYKKTPCKGDVVNILPPRGQFDTAEKKIPWVVSEARNGEVSLVHDDKQQTVPIEDVVVTVSYRDVIYPGLKVIDKVERGNPEDPYHVIINAENYHALEALTYAYAGKVDCIYILCYAPVHWRLYCVCTRCGAAGDRRGEFRPVVCGKSGGDAVPAAADAPAPAPDLSSAPSR